MANTAKKIIDWDGADPELLHTFHALPPGRYEIIQVEEDEALELTEEQIAGLHAALDAEDRREFVDGPTFVAQLQKQITERK